MITITIGTDRMAINGHADESEQEHENIGVCAMVSFLAQGCAMWTQDEDFVFDDGNTAVNMPKGEVREFLIGMLRGIEGAFPKLLRISE